MPQQIARRVSGRPGNWSRWIWVAIVLSAGVILPFLLFGTTLEIPTTEVVRLSRSRTLLVVTVVVLLSADVLLPIPSSVISTLAGYRLGFLWGTLVSAAGMSAGCLLGYVIGRGLGKHIVARFVDRCSVRDAKLIADRVGPYALALLRPVPVLAEVSVLLAGATDAAFVPFLTMTSLANVGFSAVYAAAGSWSVARGSPVLAFAAGAGIPAVALLLRTAFRRRCARLGTNRRPW